MNDLHLTLTSEERDVLVDLLSMMLKETRVEEHRTRTLTFREHVVEREHVIEKILERLGQPV
jgi:hypothetical protein